MDLIRYNRIKVVIYDFRIKQKELAEILGVNENTVSRWCNNTHQPPFEELLRIAMVFRVDVCRLLEPTDWSKETGPSLVEQFKAEKEKKKLEAKAKKKSAKKRKRR